MHIEHPVHANYWLLAMLEDLNCSDESSEHFVLRRKD